jgi:hypothetical protein
MRRSRLEIEPGAVHAILDLNDPKVGVEGDFPFESLLRFVGIDVWPAVCASEDSVDAARSGSRDGLWRRPIEGRTPVQVIDFDENGASFSGATTSEDRGHPFHSASAQIRGDPNVGAQAQRI